MKSRNLIVMALLLSLVVAAPLLAGEEEAQSTDGLFIHISHGEEDAHRVLMPLSLANMVSDKYEVRLFLDIDAVNLVVKSAPDVTYEGFEHSSRTLLTKLVEKGVEIYACPMCLQVAGHTPEELMDGVTLATPEIFAGLADGTITALDW